MKTRKIVADSSANVLKLEKTPFAAAPLKVITDEREFVDDTALNVDDMVSWFSATKARARPPAPIPPTGWKPSVTRMKFSA